MIYTFIMNITKLQSKYTLLDKTEFEQIHKDNSEDNET
jgi:hypothetical protein